MRRSVDPTATGVPTANDTEDTVPEVVAVITVSLSGTTMPGRCSSLAEFLSSLAFLTITGSGAVEGSSEALSALFEGVVLSKKKNIAPISAAKTMNSDHDVERFSIYVVGIRLFEIYSIYEYG